jgi:hypothetical protein
MIKKINRRTYMKRDYLKAVFVFLLITGLTFFICIKINNSFGVLKSGDTYTDYGKNRIYSLANYQWDPKTNTYYFDLVRENENQQLELVYANLPSEVLINGNTFKESTSFSRILLSSDWFVDDKITVVFNTHINPHHTPVYVTTTGGAATALSIFDMVFAFNLGIIFLM